MLLWWLLLVSCFSCGFCLLLLFISSAYCFCLFLLLVSSVGSFAGRVGATIGENQAATDEDDATRNNTTYAHIPLPIVYLYTVIQLSMVLCIWLVIYFGKKGGWLGILFPLFLAALLVIRVFVLPIIFSADHLEALDPYDPLPQDDAVISPQQEPPQQQEQQQQQPPPQQQQQQPPIGHDSEG